MEKLLNFGLVNIDKPAGPTSFSVSEFVRRELGLSKTSHMGTLDPKVTGVLPITLGRACKLAEYFIRHDKTYVGILETHRVCDIVELQKLIDKNFVGKIRQTPPHRSAVARVEREREVYYWKLLEASLPEKIDNRKLKIEREGKSFLFECKVEGGTYIRKLCSDLGEMIGGANMGELRRIRAGEFFEVSGVRCQVSGRLVSLYEFERAVEEWKKGNESLLREMVVPAEDAIRKVLSEVEVDKSALKSLYIGRPLLKSNVVSGDVKKGEKFAAFCGDVFVGVYRATGEDSIFGRAEFVKN
ncbi:MAG: RNA-guided pseudouridylation complex pseudouridine synthase subunit Cbf5 [archaeon]